MHRLSFGQLAKAALRYTKRDSQDRFAHSLNVLGTFAPGSHAHLRMLKRKYARTHTHAHINRPCTHTYLSAYTCAQTIITGSQSAAQ